MDKFQKDILNKLIDKYEKSKLSKSGSERNLKVKLTPKDKELQTYVGRGSFKFMERNNTLLAELESAGYLKVNRDRDGLFESVELELDNVDLICKDLNRINRNTCLNAIIKVLEENCDNGFICDFVQSEIKYIKTTFTYHKSFYNDENELKNILSALSELQMLKEEEMERNFSARVFGDSKYLDKIKNKLVSIIAKYDEKIRDEDIESNHVLEYYNLVKNSTYAMVKGLLKFKLNNQSINLKNLGCEFLLSDKMIKEMVFDDDKVEELYTVENLTTFHSLNCENAVIVYLGGFHNHTKQMLINRIAEYYGINKYYHFGDIDAGGFRIFKHLCNTSSLPFIPYRMSISELVNNDGNCKSLTDNDIKTLKTMLENEDFSIFHEVIWYMLDHNVKLEQEVLTM